MAKKIAELDEEVTPVDSADDFDDEDEDFDDEEEDEDYEDEDEDQDDDEDAEAAAALELVAEAEQAHVDAVQEYAQTVADINQQQIDRIQALKVKGFSIADVAKVYPRKLVVTAFADATEATSTV